MGKGTPGQQGNPPWAAGQPGQYNSAASGGNVYATQGGNQYINVGTGKRGLRMDTKVLLVTLLADVVFFFYGMLAYTGKNTNSDNWRAGIFLFMFLMTCGMIGRWIRRRA
jgi:DMSO reductase anchor subunit